LDAGIDNKNRHLVTVSKDTLRARATKFIAEWEGQHRERAECQIFWHEFFAMFDVRSVDIGMYEEAATRASTGGDGRIDYLIPWELAIEHKTTGEDLDKAMDQLIDYLPSLKQKQPPRLLMTCDFAHFKWHNLENGQEGELALEDLIANLDLFWWLAGHPARGAEAFEDEEEANLKATDLMAKLHDAVVATGYDEHALREWLTRILFCLFADDTDVWPRNAFVNFIHFRTQSDGSDLGPQIRMLFELLNMPPDQRPAGLDTDLADFTYINGDLFSNDLPMVWATEDVRTYLLEACRFDWSRISPAIFGSMFQNVMTPAERRHLGAHYTTLENIMKTIRPLFLDDLEEELAKANTVPALERFHEKIASLTFMDPACGCGNFLVVAYGELRRLEQECLEKIRNKQGRGDWQTLGVHLLFKVNVSQFYGIEIEEFPARIARTALYLMDHSWNREVSKVFGQYFVRFPIPASPHIAAEENALRMNWADLLPADRCDFIMGNPPFVGMAWMTKEQQEDNRVVFANEKVGGLRTGRMDYVVCWYEKAMDYIGDGSTRVAFVSTNSLFQGEQARTMAPLLDVHGFKIDFAHTTFAWSSEAKGKAHVHCVIVGFSNSSEVSKKRLFEYAALDGPPTEIPAREISIFLTSGQAQPPTKRYEPFLSGFPDASKGSQPTDGGHLIVGPDELEEVRSDLIAAKYVRPFIQSRDMLHGEQRWCLWLVNAPVSDLRSSPVIRKRLQDVADWRRNVSKTESVQLAAATPSLFTQIRQPTTSYLAMPEVSSSARTYIPGRFFEPDSIAGNKLIVFPDAEAWFFGFMHSLMWNAWMKTVSGRLKSDISFSPSIGYFTFPFPEIDDDNKTRLGAAAQVVLDARTAHSGMSLADLYDPLAMPANLVKAHNALDKVVDALFAPRKKFKSDADRLAVLFERYELLANAEGSRHG